MWRHLWTTFLLKCQYLDLLPGKCVRTSFLVSIKTDIDGCLSPFRNRRCRYSCPKLPPLQHHQDHQNSFIPRIRFDVSCSQVLRWDYACNMDNLSWVVHLCYEQKHCKIRCWTNIYRCTSVLYFTYSQGKNFNITPELKIKLPKNWKWDFANLTFLNLNHHSLPWPSQHFVNHIFKIYITKR